MEDTTSVYILHRGGTMHEDAIPTEYVNNILSKRAKIISKDPIVRDVLAKIVLVGFDFFPDSMLPDEMLRGLGFESYNEEGH